MGKRCQIKHRGPTNCPACDLDTIEALRAELELVRAELVRARERARRFYRADGTFENLASEDEAIQRRIQAAAENAKMRERLHHPCDGCPGCSSNDCPDALDIAQIDLDVWRHQAEQLRARVGWLDLLDTEEGRRTYANEALRVELEASRGEQNALRAELMLLLARLRRGVAVTATEASMRLETLAAAQEGQGGANG